MAPPMVMSNENMYNFFAMVYQTAFTPVPNDLTSYSPRKMDLVSANTDACRLKKLIMHR
jgi:hypothetical protein